MHNMGAAHIIAIDVAFHDAEVQLTNYGDFLSGWWVLYKRRCPFTSKVKVLDLQDIQRRLTFVHGASHLHVVKNLTYCEYMRPPIERYKTLAFASFEKIHDVGYAYGKKQFENMAKAGRLGRFNDWFIKEPRKKDKSASLTDYSFIDLAKIVCKLPEVSHPDGDHHHLPYFFSDDEYFSGVENEMMDSEVEVHNKLARKKRRKLKARNASANANVTTSGNPSANGIANISPDDIKLLELMLPKQPLHTSTSLDLSAVISSSSNSENENDENAKVLNADENEMKSSTTNATTTPTETIATKTNAITTPTETVTTTTNATTTPTETIATTTNATTTAAETITTTTNTTTTPTETIATTTNEEEKMDYNA